MKYISLKWFLISIFLLTLYPNVSIAQNETPSDNVAAVIAPYNYEMPSEEQTFINEVGDNGQKYIIAEYIQEESPGLSPHVDLLDHIRSVDDNSITGVLLHAGHGSPSNNIYMESFLDPDPLKAAKAAKKRLKKYKDAGWITVGANKEITALAFGTMTFGGIDHYRWVITMYDRAIINRGAGLANTKPLVHIATCYGNLMAPAYVNKGARVALGNKDCVGVVTNMNQIKTLYQRLNGKEGQDMRSVGNAIQGPDFSTLQVFGNKNTTLAPSVKSLSAPCPIQTGDKVTFTFDTKCSVENIPDITCSGCGVQDEKWVDETTLEGTVTFPEDPLDNFSITLNWGDVYSKNNTSRLDGNTSPANKNAHGPAHDDYTQEFDCSDDGSGGDPPGSASGSGDGTGSRDGVDRYLIQALDYNHLAISITPNPSTGNFQLSLQVPESNPVNLQVFSISGKQIYQTRFDALKGNYSRVVQLPDGLPDGIYFVKIDTGSSSTTQKIVISK